ncbi:MAG: ribonuclease HII, partial [Armatimonadota bacterium]|nr:ribonuclease HII [Armatimonadota bacterium]
MASTERHSRNRNVGPPTRTIEQALLNSGTAAVAGVDEAGRGSLAGPVVAAAVVLPRRGCPEGLDDSKRLDPARRLTLFHQILNTAISVGVHFVGPARIDEINILRASHEAMRGAVLSLSSLPEMALIDGLPLPHFPCPH